MWHNISSIKFLCYKIYKIIPNKEGSIKTNNPITNKMDRYKIKVIRFCKNNIGLKIKILGCMFGIIDFVRMLTRDD